MYIKLVTLIEKYSLQGKINGIIHVGAHHGEEYEDYIAAGIKKQVWVEPCQAALTFLHNRLENLPDIKILGCAFGDTMGPAIINTETANTGQGNSILTPKKHLEQFPGILFPGRETIMVFPMDTFAFLQVGWYNFLNMDVQGFEDRVLKGGRQVLRHIDYVYTEVNQAEVYEGCAQISELDRLLSDFDRVETFWCDNGGASGDWGDAFYIRKTAR